MRPAGIAVITDGSSAGTDGKEASEPHCRRDRPLRRRTYRWRHLSRPSPELLAALGDGWLPSRGRAYGAPPARLPARASAAIGALSGFTQLKIAE
jgi:hypothetical protein